MTHSSRQDASGSSTSPERALFSGSPTTARKTRSKETRRRLIKGWRPIREQDAPAKPEATRGGRATTPSVACPVCLGQVSTVFTTRDGPGHTIRRRRRCTKCQGKFTTYEMYVGRPKGRNASHPDLLETKALLRECFALLSKAIQKFPDLGAQEPPRAVLETDDESSSTGVPDGVPPDSDVLPDRGVVGCPTGG